MLDQRTDPPAATSIKSKVTWIWWGAYFAVSGILGIIALNSDLLTAALWLLVIPALILSLGANFFLWGWPFFIADCIRHSCGSRARLKPFAVAAVFLIGTLAVLPIISNYITDLKARSLTSDDKIWSGSLAGTKSIALLNFFHEWRNSCTKLCQDLLYSGNVQSVLIGDSPKFGADLNSAEKVIRFRIEHRNSCGMVRDATPSVLQRLAAGDCIVGEAAVLGDADAAWIVTQPSRDDIRALISGSRSSLQLRAGSGWSEVHRVTSVSVRHLITPLILGPSGRPGGSADRVSLQPIWLSHVAQGIQVSEDTKTRERRLFDLMPDVPSPVQQTPQATTPFKSTAEAPGPSAPSMAETLWTSINDPEIKPASPNFMLVDAYFEAVSRGDSADMPLIAGLIRDPRVSQTNRIGFVVDRLGPDAALLAAPILDRTLANLGQPNAKPYDRNLALAFRKLPPCIAKGMRADLERISMDANMRFQAAPMLSRLADSGASALPELVGLVEEGRAVISARSRRSGFDPLNDGRALVMAGLDGLAILGPEAHEATPTVASLIADVAKQPWGGEMVEHAIPAMVRMQSSDKLRQLLSDGREVRLEQQIKWAEKQPDMACHI